MLTNLPPELLAQIVHHLPTAQALHHLSSCCHKLHNFVETEGWRIFVQSKFPSVKSPPDWKSAAHGLSTLSKNWDRKALVARYIRPRTILNLTTGKSEPQWKPPKGQTMGSQTLLDGIEEWTGSSWAARNEILAFSAGAEIVVRIKGKGNATHALGQTLANGDSSDRSHNATEHAQWLTYKPQDALQGADDITALQLFKTDSALKSLACDNISKASVLVGTARGDLRWLDLPTSPRANSQDRITRASFRTRGRIVRSLDITKEPSSLMVAAIGETVLSLYDCGDVSGDVLSQDELDICEAESFELGQRIYSSKWLGSSRIGVGLGPSQRALRVYQVREDGIARTPIREFLSETSSTASGSGPSLIANTSVSKTSVHAITPLPLNSQAGHADGDVFFSGDSRSLVKLHDLRSPHNHEHLYWNPIDDGGGGIVSLQTFGRERIAAGLSQQSIVKFFDIRVTGGRAYDYRSIGGPLAHKSSRPSRRVESGRSVGWSLFLGKRSSGSSRQRVPYAQRREDERAANSLVYSLCSPSSASPTLYAGIEGRVVQVDFTSSTDKHPDPALACEVHLSKENQPSEDVLNLGMYMHNPAGAVVLMKQRDMSEQMKDPDTESEFDGRWQIGRFMR